MKNIFIYILFGFNLFLAFFIYYFNVKVFFMPLELLLYFFLFAIIIFIFVKFILKFELTRAFKYFNVAFALVIILLVIIPLSIYNTHLGISISESLNKYYEKTHPDLCYDCLKGEPTKQQIIDQLNLINLPLYFDKRELDVNQSNAIYISFGIKNNGSSYEKYRIEIDYLAQNKTTISMVPNKNGALSNVGSFFWNTAPQSFLPGEAKIFDVRYYAPKYTGVYLFNVLLVNNSSNETIAEQTIFINVK